MNIPFNTPRNASLDSRGHLILPEDILQEYGLEAGGELILHVTREGVLLKPSLSQLRKIYIELTNRCNLSCRTCIRNAWDEPMGSMSPETFQRILDAIIVMTPKPSIFFGGFGEPLTHPNLAKMIWQASQVASRVEIITNGILLSEKVSTQLIEAGLGTLWISLDGASPESYADVRFSESLGEILKNIARFRHLYRQLRGDNADIGAAFVAMKRNIDELPKLLDLSSRVGINRYLITNVLPYTPAMCEEVLYRRSLDRVNWQASMWHPAINMTEIDLTPETREALFKAWSTRPGKWFKKQDTCPFVEQRSMSIGWEGSVSPCLALLHSHESYLFELKRSIKNSWLEM